MFTRHPANPILRPEPAHDWEARVRTNPGVCYDPDRDRYVMLYRAAGHDEKHFIHLGLAVSDNGYDFTPASDRPALSPSVDGFDAGCLEDPRITYCDGWFLVTYAARAFPPGQYWKPNDGKRYDWPVWPDIFPHQIGKNQTATGLALTRDFKTFIRCGSMTDPMADDRDVILFPERIGGRWWKVHRPLQWCGPGYGNPKPAIWINDADDLLNWDPSRSRMIAQAERDWERKVGANAPPIRTDAGWLLIYHGVADDGDYRLGALLLDPDRPDRVTHRTATPIFEPTEPYEKGGYYAGGNVVFPCGNLVIDGRLVLYYGTGDRDVCVASCDLGELLGELRAQPWTPATSGANSGAGSGAGLGAATV